MRTIHAIVRNGNLQPIEPIGFPDNTRLTLALLESDDLSADALARVSQSGEAFDFLNDPREDIYSETDGEAV
jgi:hypothetical protein